MNKNVLRKFNKNIRNSIPCDIRAEADKLIFTRLINSASFINSDIILTYVSVGSEVDTLEIIAYSLSAGKKVAVPVCNNGEMKFYFLNNLSQLIEGKYGIPTVDSVNNIPVTDFTNALCIVPGLSFDSLGNRIGYGAGYYDKFLSLNPIKTIGLCYQINFSLDIIPTEPFDYNIDCILTENMMLATSNKEVNTYE